jgi:hypothetical protein
MTRKELLDRISIDPNDCFGRPCPPSSVYLVLASAPSLPKGTSSHKIKGEKEFAKTTIFSYRG